MRQPGNVKAVLIALAVSLAGLAGCSAPAEELAQPSQTPAPASNPVSTPQRDTAVEYRNTEYGFSFSLPAGWQGYTTTVDEWAGYTVDASGDVPSEQGPQVLIRHPKWTAEAPRQDIPIMVFTLEQWSALQEGKFHIGAAPMNPTELGRNARYVFALPARYNYAFPDGYEEVEQILQGHPLQAFEPA